MGCYMEFDLRHYIKFDLRGPKVKSYVELRKGLKNIRIPCNGYL